jgi:hypothetical protein
MFKHSATTDDDLARLAAVRGDGPPELGPDDVGDLEPLPPHIALADSPEEARKTPVSPMGIPVGKPARIPAQNPMGMALGMVPGDALGMPSGSALGQPQGTTTGGNSDWLLWWGTFQRVPGARLHVWRCSPSGLNVGEALLVMTVEDAQRMRLDDHATALAYLTGRFGPGRFRLTPRSDQGTKLPGTQSLVAIIDEDTPMQVTMSPTATAAAPMLAPAGAIDRETAIEIERMRLTAEIERERETRRERQRDVREERRREKEADRERRRDEDRKRRDEDERRRADRELQMHTLMVQMLKEVAGGRAGSGKEDAFMAAILAKVGQPDPLVLKLLDTQGKREELTDFFKVQAESMRMASTLQTDSLKQVMVASQEVQGQLMRQAAEVATQRDGGDGWAGIGSVLSATASIVAALRSGNPTGSPTAPLPVAPVTMAERRPSMAMQRPRPAITAVPAAPAKQSDPVGESLRQVRAVHRGGQGEDDTALRQVVAGLPSALSEAIRAGDVAAIQREVMPVVQVDPTLGEWLSQPGIGDWLTSYLQRIRVELTGGEDAPATVMSPSITSYVTDDDLIV